MPRRASSPAFIGRTQELADLEAALAAARGGTPTAALVAGESGVGKTRLVEELVARAVAEDVRVLTGDCVNLGDGELPYAPIVACLRQLRHDLDDPGLEAVLGAARPEIALLVPELADPEADGARRPAPEQALLFEQLLGVLGRLAERGPLALVVEDLHWADRSTREFLVFLLRNARRERILLVATYRTEELHRRHPLRPFLAEAERTANVQRIALAPFTRGELAEQLAAILGKEPEPLLVDELFARAEGNPFFTEELLAATQGDRSKRLPDSIRDALLLRVEALAEPTQQLLRIAAAAGRRVGHGLLASACPVTEADLNAGLREALAHNMLTHDPGAEAYAFRHVLLREVLYDELLPGERGPLHRALARALQDNPALSVASGGVGAELAFHWLAAHDLPAAMEASLSAGADAERIAAFAEAQAHFERALELWDGVPAEQRPAAVTVVGLHRRAAEAAYLAGDHDRAVGLARRALALIDADEDPTTTALVEERLGRYLFRAGQMAEAIAVYRSAEARLPAGVPTRERALLLAAEGHTLLLSGSKSEAAARCEQALAIAAETGADDLEAGILATLGVAQLYRGDSELGLAQLRRALQIAEATGDHEVAIRSTINLSEALDELGRTAEAAQVALDGLPRLRSARVGLAVLAGDGAVRLLKLGRWDEARAFLDDAAIPLTGMAGSAVLEARGTMEVLRGQYDRAERLLGEADRLVGDAGGTMWQGPVAIARAEAALWQGAPDDALTRLAGGLVEAADDESLFYVAPVFATAARAHADVAITARALGDAAGADAATAAAGELTERLRARADGPFVPPECERHLLVCALEARRAAGDADTDGWSTLAERWEELERPYPAAYARWRAGEAALGAGDRDRAQQLLGRAAETARGLGAAPLLGEIESLAQRGRVRLTEARPPAASAPETTAERIGLTPRELDVLRLLTAGKTNGEIAAELFMSRKTASVHVSRILTKLDARGRVEAASLAHRLGLVESDAA